MQIKTAWGFHLPQSEWQSQEKSATANCSVDMGNHLVTADRALYSPALPLLSIDPKYCKSASTEVLPISYAWLDCL